MNTNPDTSGSNASNTPPSSPASQVREALDKALPSADSTVTQSVQHLQLVHQARVAQLSRTAASLKAQFGTKDSRVIDAEAAVAAETTTAGRVSMVSRQIATPAPQVSAGGWVLHGRVFNAQLQPAARYTVFLVDSKKNYQQQFGFAYTDNTGYFRINYPGTGSKSETAGSATEFQVQQLFVEVANPKAQPVFLSTTAFQPAAGSVTYQNITLPAGEKPLGDPPPAIRKVALPDQGKKA